MTFGNDQLVELKTRIEVLITAQYGSGAGAKLREFFDSALKDMVIEKERERVLRELNSILDQPA